MNLNYSIYVLKVNIYSQIILLFTFIPITLFAHPHTIDELEAQPHTHSQNENNLIDDLEGFNDLDFQSSNPVNDTYSKQYQDKNNLIFLNDNLYLLDNDFDFGNNEFVLQKIKLNNNDLEIANEYNDFLNILASEKVRKGRKTSSANTSNKKQFLGLNGKINDLESDKLILNQKIENLENKLHSAIMKSGQVNYLESDKLILNQKIEHLENQLHSAATENARVKELESEKRRLNQKIENLENKLQSTIYNDLKASYEDLKASYEDLQKSLEGLKQSSEYNNTANSSRRSGLGISVMLGGTIPIMQDGLDIGPNVGLRFLETPLSFTLAGMDTKVSAEIYNSIMFPSDNTNYWYSLMNIVGTISISPISSMEIRSGLGCTLAKMGPIQKIALSIPLDLIYYLPIDLSGFKIGFNLLSQITFGHPNKEGTTSHLNAGLVIKTPL